MVCALVSSVLTGHKTQDCTLKPNAVKIFITDCTATVKRNSFPSTPTGALEVQANTPEPTCVDESSMLPDLTTIAVLPSIVSHRTVSYFVYCNAIFTVLLLTPPCLRVREIPEPGAVAPEIGMFT